MSMIMSGIEERLSEYLRHWYSLRIMMPKKDDGEPSRSFDLKWEAVTSLISPDIMELCFLIESSEGPYYTTSIKSSLLRRISSILEEILTKPVKNVKLSEARQWVLEHIPPPDRFEIVYDDNIHAIWDDWGASCAQEIKSKVV